MTESKRRIYYGLQYVAPGPDEKDANVYFLPQKKSSELKFVKKKNVKRQQLLSLLDNPARGKMVARFGGP